MKKFLKNLPTVFFVAFIFIMTILFFALPKKEYSSAEKRYLSDFPKLSVDTFFSGDFGEDFETYLSDHTAFRQFWVGLNSYYNLSLGNPLSNGIYHCKDGYLVNDPPVTDRFDTNIDIIAEFASKTDLPSTMVLAPSTGYVANDVLPNNHIVYHDDELVESAKETLKENGVSFVDLRSEFKEAYRNGAQLYYKTDHHWTTSGAHLAYCNLSDKMGFKANNKDNFEITSYDDFYGTTYSSSGYWLTKPDVIEVWQSKSLKDSELSISIADGKNSVESTSMFFLDNLKDDDKYPVFLDGNHPYTLIENKTLKESGNNKKLLIIKDSFAHSLTPFLADHYSEIVMIDMRYYKEKVSQLIENEKFTEILFVYSIDNLGSDTDIAWLE